MSESLHDHFHVNFDAATELEEQSKRAKRILETLAANLAANDSRLPSDDRDVVRLQHVRVAAEILFNSAGKDTTAGIRDVFVRYSHKDDHFIEEPISRISKICPPQNT